MKLLLKLAFLGYRVREMKRSSMIVVLRSQMRIALETIVNSIYFAKSPDAIPSHPFPQSSEFYPRVKCMPIKRLEVKAPLEVRLDSHQLINSLLHVIRVVPIENQHTGHQYPFLLGVKGYQRLVSWQPTPDTRR
jgi:hypothetical protein